MMEIHEQSPSAPVGASLGQADAHAQWLADWLRAWPGISPDERARHFRSLAREISARAAAMPAEARIGMLVLADRYMRMAERNDKQPLTASED
jgi:hypothetical protein